MASWHQNPSRWEKDHNYNCVLRSWESSLYLVNLNLNLPATLYPAFVFTMTKNKGKAYFVVLYVASIKHMLLP